MTRTDIANLALSKLGDTVITSIDDATNKSARQAKLHYDQALGEVLRSHFWGFAMSTATVAAKINNSAPATCILNPTGTKNAILLTAVASGTGGNLLSGEILADTTGAIAVTVTGGTAIAVAPISGSTAAQVISAINNDAAAKLLVVASNSGTDDGTGTMAAVAKTLLAGGIDIVIPGWAAAFELPSDFCKLRAVYDTDGNKIDKFDLARVLGVRCLVTGNYSSVIFDYVAVVDDPTDQDPLFTAAMVTLLASRMARSITGSEGMESQLRQTYEQVDLPSARCADAQDTQSGENHPLKQMLAGALTGPRGDFFPDLDDI